MSNCKEFLSQVLDKLGEYFENHSFRLVHSYEDGKFDHCFLIFISEKCCLKLIRDRDNVIIKLAPLWADRNYYGGIEEDWFSIGTVMVLLRDMDEDLANFTSPLMQVESSGSNIRAESRVERELEKYRALFLALGDVLFAIFETNRFEAYKIRLKALAKPQQNMLE